MDSAKTGWQVVGSGVTWSMCGPVLDKTPDNYAKCVQIMEKAKANGLPGAYRIKEVAMQDALDNE